LNHNEEVVIEGLESSMELWLLGNREDAIENFGEDIVANCEEELNRE
jgi:hypothetical protein